VEVFKLATGWLGWPPDLAMLTPIPQIMLALEGKADFVAQTNPFGPTKPRKKTDAEKLQEQRSLFHRRKLDAAQRVKDMKAQRNGK